MQVPVGYRPRRGDVVTIDAMVKYDASRIDEEVCVQVGEVAVWVPISSLDSLKRVKIEVGDQVKSGILVGIVRAICGDNVWVESTDGIFQTVSAQSLIHYDPVSIDDSPSKKSGDWIESGNKNRPLDDPKSGDWIELDRKLDPLRF